MNRLTSTTLKPRPQCEALLPAENDPTGEHAYECRNEADGVVKVEGQEFDRCESCAAALGESLTYYWEMEVA